MNKKKFNLLFVLIIISCLVLSLYRNPISFNVLFKGTDIIKQINICIDFINVQLYLVREEWDRETGFFKPRLIAFDMNGMSSYMCESMKEITDADILVADFDGDGNPEIFLHCYGYVFQTSQQILLKYKDSAFKEVCSINDPKYTGYMSKFKEGKKLEIKNRYTLYADIIDIPDDIQVLYPFDENGMVDSNYSHETIFTGYILDCKLVDIDLNGAFCIEVSQDVFFRSRLYYLGEAKTILKYNQQTKVFEINAGKVEVLDYHYSNRIAVAI